MADPDASPTQPRVNCPACGKRFRVDPAQIEATGGGAGVRCRDCGASFRIRLGRDGRVKIVTGKERARKRPGRKRVTATRTVTNGSGALYGMEEAFLAPAGMGERIGRYEVEALLGRGGMAAVYRVFDPAANRHVALKVISSDAPEEDILRFRREVEVQGNIQHSHIMPIFDSGTLGRSRYFAMELLKDPLSLATLARLVREGHAARDPLLRPVGSLEGMLRRTILPVCEAVHHANVREGVVHRDLKPDNILIDRNGLRPMVIDFGVCSLIERKNQRLAHLPSEGAAKLEGGGVRVTGTLVYMPPEQARGEVDRRGDVWALGAILHFLVTGAPPLTPASRGGVRTTDRIEGLRLLIEQAKREEKPDEAALFQKKLQKVETGRDRDLVSLQRDVLSARYLPLPPRTPRPFKAIVEKAMAAEPEHRYRHALELRDDLVRWLEGKPARAVTKRMNPLSGLAYRTGLLVRRHKWASAFLASLVVAGVWVATIMLSANGNEAGEARTTAYVCEAKDGLQGGSSLEEIERCLRKALADSPASQEALGLLAQVEGRRRLARALERAQVHEAALQDALAQGRSRDAELALARLREVHQLQIDPELGRQLPEDVLIHVDRIEATMRGDRAVHVTAAPEGVSITAYPRGRVVRWEEGRDLGVQDRLPFGAWILRLRRRDGELWLPISVPPERATLEVPCPLDPADVPSTCVYVSGGRVEYPLAGSDVSPLLWDRHEITIARYAAWLRTLDAEEQRRRVPRQVGTPDAPGVPLWPHGPEGFVPPPGFANRPVESISVHDAQALALAAGARLPTAAEWAWAATATGPHLTAVGPLDALPQLGLRIDAESAGSTDVGAVLADRSPFGVLDLAGNVQEMTGTRETWRGVRGWLLMGGGYRTSPVRALVTESEAVDGRTPLRGVGFRLVRAPNAAKR